MSKHIIALQIFAGFVQEFAKMDKSLQFDLMVVQNYYHKDSNTIDTATNYAIENVEELIAKVG